MSPLGLEKLFSGREKREGKKEDTSQSLPGGFRIGQEVDVEIPGTFGNKGDDILPEKWEWVLIEGAMEKCWDRVDPTNTAEKKLCRETFERGRALIRQAANTAPGESQVMQNHRPFMNRTSGVHGPSYPANFDITP